MGNCELSELIDKIEKELNTCELADKIQENLIVNNGNIEEKEKHYVYDSNLPEGITLDMINSLVKYNTLFIEALDIATTNIKNNRSKENVVNTSVDYLRCNDKIDTKIHKLVNEIENSFFVNSNNTDKKEKYTIYDSNLPSGITPDIVKSIVKYNEEFTRASRIAAARVANKLFKENKNRKVIKATIGFFGPNDKIEIKVQKNKTFNNSSIKEIGKDLFTKVVVIFNQSLKGVMP